MRKTIKTLIVFALCLCIATPTVAFAVESEKQFASPSEYVFESRTFVETDETTKNIMLSKIVNRVSEFFINNVSGSLLNLVVPDSSAVLDYEDFDDRRCRRLAGPKDSQARTAAPQARTRSRRGDSERREQRGGLGDNGRAREGDFRGGRRRDNPGRSRLGPEGVSRPGRFG